jgi:hypothetical protein
MGEEGEREGGSRIGRGGLEGNQVQRIGSMIRRERGEWRKRRVRGKSGRDSREDDQQGKVRWRERERSIKEK